MLLLDQNLVFEVGYCRRQILLYARLYLLVNETNNRLFQIQFDEVGKGALDNGVDKLLIMMAVGDAQFQE